MTKYGIIFSLTIFIATTINCKNADVIIFSRKRPLQFECLLDSLEKHCQGVETVTALVMDDGSTWVKAYESVAEKHPNCNIVWQKNQYEFKPLLLKMLKRCPSNYILFLVDDNVFIGPVSTSICIEALDQTNAWCFSLRMGEHINYCFTQNISSTPPAFSKFNEEILIFNFDKTLSDWGYPNTVDATIYQKTYLLRDFTRLPFSNPNQLEGKWNRLASKNIKGLCFSNSRVINAPINLVQQGNNRTSSTNYPAEKLLELFWSGKKMSFENCYPGFNNSPHVSVMPEFISAES